MKLVAAGAATQRAQLSGRWAGQAGAHRAGGAGSGAVLSCSVALFWPGEGGRAGGEAGQWAGQGRQVLHHAAGLGAGGGGSEDAAWLLV